MGGRQVAALLLACLAGCAAPPSEPGARWQLGTWTLSAAPLPAGEFAVLAFEDPPATPGAGAGLADAIAAALRDRGQATLSRAWAEDHLPAAGVVVVRGRLLRWREDLERGWLRAEVDFTLAADGSERLGGSIEYEVLLAPESAAGDFEARQSALRGALAAVLAQELLDQVD